MGGTRDLGNKIRTLSNMQKVMHAMNMIATVKLRKLIRFREPLSRFQDSIEKISVVVRTSFAEMRHPVVSGYSEPGTAHIVLITADKGLCGSHNTSVERLTTAFVAESRTRGVGSEFSCIGKKGADYCMRNGMSVTDREENNERGLTPDRIRGISSRIFERFITGRVQEVHLAWDRFDSAIHHEPVMIRLLPLGPAETAPGGREDGISTEPEAKDFLVSAGSLFLYYGLSAALIESRLSEHSTRMTAMENATRNADDLISRYRLEQNRTRQNAITNEIAEIVSGMQSMR